jgi:hypothetical protein
VEEIPARKTVEDDMIEMMAFKMNENFQQRGETSRFEIWTESSHGL